MQNEHGWVSEESERISVGCVWHAASEFMIRASASKIFSDCIPYIYVWLTKNLTSGALNLKLLVANAKLLVQNKYFMSIIFVKLHYSKIYVNINGKKLYRLIMWHKKQGFLSSKGRNNKKNEFVKKWNILFTILFFYMKRVGSWILSPFKLRKKVQT